jgi:lipopolysaccharide/colanic/teichoic acid biosynthesis glycosyltransferase
MERVNIVKRIVDVIAGLVLAVVTLPVVLVLLLGSTVAFRAAPLFVQPRLGRGGSLFQFVKVRTLPVSTPVDADKYALGAIPLGRWGRALRRRHLDELPQLWLVVFGRMSLVGPRPEMPRLAATFDPDFVSERTSVRPGCTGLWQISVSVTRLIGESPEYDLHYVRHRTLRLDAWILARTLASVVGRPKISSLREIPSWTGAAQRPVAALG